MEHTNAEKIAKLLEMDECFHPPQKRLLEYEKQTHRGDKMTKLKTENMFEIQIEVRNASLQQINRIQDRIVAQITEGAHIDISDLGIENKDFCIQYGANVTINSFELGSASFTLVPTDRT